MKIHKHRVYKISIDPGRFIKVLKCGPKRVTYETWRESNGFAHKCTVSRALYEHFMKTERHELVYDKEEVQEILDSLEWK